MQTFVPFGARFALNAQVLDRQRLGKQRVEAFQIIQALTRPDYGWQSHPAVKMWRGHVTALAVYGAIMCHEWRSRGYKDTLLERFEPYFLPPMHPDVPEWLGRHDIMESHRSNLIRKMPAHYGAIWPETSPDLPYIWPV